ncbi:hypothetical protein EXS74_02920 [Candidatus Woesearchaeota archaeon]|nr:hypothetical protein [Candidatus Woesearchaeota archaeon]
MVIHRVTIYGSTIVDKFTHDEAYPFVGQERTTVIIPGDMFDEFRTKYKRSLRSSKITLEIDYTPNNERVKDCQDPYKGPRSHIGTLRSLDGILVEEEK